MAQEKSESTCESTLQALSDPWRHINVILLWWGCSFEVVSHIAECPVPTLCKAGILSPCKVQLPNEMYWKYKVQSRLQRLHARKREAKYLIPLFHSDYMLRHSFGWRCLNKICNLNSFHLASLIMQHSEKTFYKDGTILELCCPIW
jgi:hypothetical protein